MSKAYRDRHAVIRLRCKLHNRRITGDLLADGDVVWRFRRLMPDGTVQDKAIRLSGEALARMCQMANMLRDKLREMRRENEQKTKGTPT